MSNCFLSQRRLGLNRVFVTTGYWLAGFSFAILAACSSQDSENTDAAIVNNALTATKIVANADTDMVTMPTTGTSPRLPTADLLANLALTYPGGVLPAERVAAAAEQLAQNPAALKFNASSATISSQSGTFTPQAATTYTVGLSAPVQRAQNTTLFGSYFFSIYPSEMANALILNPTWNLEGTAFHASLGINPGLAPVYRFRNLINGSYLYTINDGEKNDILANYASYFTLEGPAWYASPGPATGYSALYRFRNLTNNTYLFSAYESEKDAIVANYAGIFLLEGISYYVRQTAPLELSVVAGTGTSGNADGAGTAAQINRIFSMAQTSSGNIYATNLANHTIRQITPSGAVNTFAGLPGTSGFSDGSLAAARFKSPWGIVRDSAGFLFVSDRGNHTIRRISADSVSTFAGLAGTPNSTDATGGAARFNAPSGMTIDVANNIYLTDSSNQTIRKITPTGVVTTIAGLAGSTGLVNATGSSARFNSPTGIAIDTSNNLFVVDFLNHVIRKITPAGLVSTFAGSSIGTPGNSDGTGANARFLNPVGISIDANNNLYVSDRGNGTIRKITPSAVVSTVVGNTNAALPFAEGVIPSSLGSNFEQAVHAVRVFGPELYLGTDTRLLKVNGLP